MALVHKHMDQNYGKLKCWDVLTYKTRLMSSSIWPALYLDAETARRYLDEISNMMIGSSRIVSDKIEDYLNQSKFGLILIYDREDNRYYWQGADWYDNQLQTLPDHWAGHTVIKNNGRARIIKLSLKDTFNANNCFKNFISE